MRQLISNIGTDYAALFVTGIAILIVTLIYLWWVSELFSFTQFCLLCLFIFDVSFALARYKGKFNLINVTIV